MVTRVTQAITTLYIFPHAGGSADFYVPFAKQFTSDIKRVAVQYPSRRGSHDVGSFTSISELADKVCRMVSPRDVVGGEVAFFGHSMGALVAFEVARRFQNEDNAIAALFVSACAAPGRSGYDYIPETDRGLLDAVSEMTGVRPDFLENEEFAARILPTLRGFKAITNYRCPPDVILSSPIYVYFADGDEVATLEKVAPWAERTDKEFATHEFTGHHFYLSDHLPGLVAAIEARLAALCVAD